MMFIGKSYVIAIIKFIIGQLFADFTINSFKSSFLIQSKETVIPIFKLLALLLRYTESPLLLCEIEGYCFVQKLILLKFKYDLSIFGFLNL